MDKEEKLKKLINILTKHSEKILEYNKRLKETNINLKKKINENDYSKIKKTNYEEEDEDEMYKTKIEKLKRKIKLLSNTNLIYVKKEDNIIPQIEKNKEIKDIVDKYNNLLENEIKEIKENIKTFVSTYNFEKEKEKEEEEKIKNIESFLYKYIFDFNQTEVQELIWDLKGEDINFSIKNEKFKERLKIEKKK